MPPPFTSYTHPAGWVEAAERSNPLGYVDRYRQVGLAQVALGIVKRR